MKKLLFIILIFISSGVCAVNYYVKNTGSDAANGLTAATAWQTLTKVNTKTFSPGDSILFNRGDTWIVATLNGTDYLNVNHSGTVSQRIVYGSYGLGNKPIIMGRKSITGWNVSGNWTNSSGNIWYMTVSNTTGAYSDNTRGRTWLNGVEVQHSSSTTVPTSLTPWTHDSTTLYVYSVGNPSSYYSNIEDGGVGYESFSIAAHYITIQNFDLRGLSESVYMINSDNIIIENCNIGYDCTQYGLRASYSNNIIIRNNTFDSGDHLNDLWYAKNTEAGLWVWSGCNNWDIYNNNFMDWGHSAYDIIAVDISNPTTNILFHNNYITCANSDYGRGFAISCKTGMTGIEVYNNLIYNTPTQNQVDAPGVKIHNNIIDGVRGMLSYRTDGAYGIFIYLNNGFSDAPNNIEIDNNTIKNCLNPGIATYGKISYVGTSIHDNYIRNNIIYNCDVTNHYQIYIDDNTGTLNQIIQNNLLYGAGITDLVYYGHSATNIYPHTVAEFNAENGTAGDVISGNIVGDPLFISSAYLHLQSTSPAINAGINVGLTTDYDGNPIVGIPDIGAYEFGVPSPVFHNGSPLFHNGVIITY